jgi:hypothetical protein
MIKIIIVLCMITAGISATVCTPEFFGKNEFLKGFITYELLSILAIIMTVTLASIANIQPHAPRRDWPPSPYRWRLSAPLRPRGDVARGQSPLCQWRASEPTCRASFERQAERGF